MKKKIFVILVAFLFVFSSLSSIQSQAASNKNKEVVNEIDNEVEEGLYSEPIYMGTYEYYPENSKTNTNTGEINPTCIACGVPHYTYTIYDMGITQSWNWLSNPYFIMSIARGETYSTTETVSATIQATFDGTWNTGEKSSVASSWGLSGSYTKSLSKTITLSGPDAGYSSRSFYYKKGTHKHKLKIVEKYYDGGVLKSTKEYYKYANKPAIYSYSVDYK